MLREETLTEVFVDPDLLVVFEPDDLLGGASDLAGYGNGLESLGNQADWHAGTQTGISMMVVHGIFSFSIDLTISAAGRCDRSKTIAGAGQQYEICCLYALWETVNRFPFRSA